MADLIFERIKHGDEAHQQWLREKSHQVAEEWFRLASEEAKRLLCGIRIE